MAISDGVKAKLNKMNRAAQDAVLGTVVQTAQNDIAALQNLIKASGSYTVTADDQTAGALTIDTEVTITGFIVQIYRSDILLGSYDVSAATTVLTIATNGTDYVVTEDDVVNYIVF